MLLPVLFFLTALCSAQDWSSSARELARKIGRQDISNLTVRNASSLSETEVAEVKRTIEAELGARLQRADGANVIITLSENVQQYLWVAEIQRGEERDVVMLNVFRPIAAAVPQAPVTIEKKLVWEQETPILDVAMSGATVIVLEPEAVSFHREGQLISLSIAGGKPAPRDPRGRLAVDGETFQAFLPGMLCRGAVSPAPSMTCAESSGAGMAAGRNYFTEPNLLPFFSIATLSNTLRLVAGVDGQTHVYGGSRELSAFSGWGSDIAAIESGCRSGRQILATKPGETAESDAVQAYEWIDRATPTGDPATFSGPVTALWSSGPRAVVVTRGSAGRYAAYSLAITCSR